MGFFILGLVIALIVAVLYFAWDRGRCRHGRMRPYHSGAPAAP